MGRSSLCSDAIGTTFESKIWLSLDPCGLVCIWFSVGIHALALYVITFYLAFHDTASIVIYSVFYIPCFLLALASLFMCFTTNPGAVPMGARPLPDDYSSESEGSTASRRKRRFCHKCLNNYKPPRAHHDSVTGRCIVKMDHYCPWVCNAVGALNHKFFFLFILYTFLSTVLAVVVIGIRVSICGVLPDKDDDSDDGCDDFHSIPVFILFVTGVTFMLFTICMLAEQIDPVTSNTSKIARMKIRAGQATIQDFCKVTVDMNELFGGEGPEFAWHWLLPTPVWFPEGMRDVVLGYHWEPSYGEGPWEDDVSIPSGGLHSRTEDSMDVSPPSVGSAAVGILQEMISPGATAKGKYSLLAEEDNDESAITPNLDGISIDESMLKKD